MLASVVWDGPQPDQFMAPAQLWAGPTGEGVIKADSTGVAIFKNAAKRSHTMQQGSHGKFISSVERRGRDRSLGTRVVEGGGERE